MISRTFAATVAAGFSLLAFAGCSNDPTLTGTNVPSNFIQIDRVGRPAINTIFAPFAQHDANDRGVPSNDAKIIGPEIAGFMTQTAGRSAATATAAQALLLTNNADVLLADLSQSGLAGYLGVETGGKIGAAFGGRGLTDDVMTTNLGIAFGNTLTTLGLTTDDGKENNGQNGTPQLSTDNVTSSSVTATSTFPYLAAPQ
jgi:Domain of unknown function (DUF4331)